MKCENFLCVYEENGKCSLCEIYLDVDGRCVNCIYPDIDKTVLKNAKEQTIKKMEEK